MGESVESHVDLTWPPNSEGSVEDARRSDRPWLGIHFECCDVYARVMRRPDELQYTGRCPKCGRKVHVKVGPGGVRTRLFRAKVV